MDTLSGQLMKAMESYTGQHYNGTGSLLYDPLANTHAVIFFRTDQTPRTTSTMMSARVVSDTIIIDEDYTSKPLVDMLLQMGVPREKIILAYAGEPVPPELDVLPAAPLLQGNS